MNTLRHATPEEASALSDIAVRSKAHWGYDQAFMDKCKDELQVPPKACEAGMVSVLERDGEIAGFYRLEVELLSDLFVDPPYIGTGVGKELFNAAAVQAHELGYQALMIHSDPFAEDFYLHMGTKRIGSEPSGSIPGRVLPLLSYDLLSSPAK